MHIDCVLMSKMRKNKFDWSRMIESEVKFEYEVCESYVQFMYIIDSIYTSYSNAKFISCYVLFIQLFCILLCLFPSYQ